MDTMDLDVEMDVDVDLVPDDPIMPDPEPRDTHRDRSPGEIDDAAEDENTPVPTKIHVRGLDIMNPDEVKAYVAEHHPEDPVERIEWIDDSSANLLFSSDAAAARALSSLALENVQNLPLRTLVSAKPFSKRPEVMLQVRLATKTDKKQVGAAQRSRFYLLNPEYDPEERRRRDPRRYRERDGDGYNRRRTRDTRRDDIEDHFDASMYDDDQATLSSRAVQARPRRRRSYTPDTDSDMRAGNSSYRNDNRGRELFPNGPSNGNGFRRNRSASPTRDRDGDRTMDDDIRNTAAERNREKARTIRSRLSHEKGAKELFPDKSRTGSGRLGDEVEDTAVLLAKGIMLPLMDESNDVLVSHGRKLEDRITVPGKGRLAERITSAEETTSSSFSIRGTAAQKSVDQGFSIKGSAGKSAKELFPDKLGANSKKELFADKLEGRSRPRRRAGDLFD